MHSYGLLIGAAL